MKTRLPKWLRLAIVLLVFPMMTGAVFSAKPDHSSDQFFVEEDPLLRSHLSPLEQRRIDRIQEQPMLKQLHFARPVPSALDHSAFSMSLFPDKTINVQQTGTDQREGLFTWIGRVEGIDQSQLYITLQNGYIIGRIWMSDEIIEITPIHPGLVAIAEFGVDPNLKDLHINVPNQPKEHHPPAWDGDDADDRSEIRVLIAYASYFAGEDREYLETNSQSYITQSNLVYQNSNISTSLRLSYFSLTDYVESDDAHTDLGRLQDSGDGYLDEIHRYRNESGSDVVVLIGDFKEACGVAYLYEGSSYAFAVVEYRCPRSFAHEVGHIQGAQHDDYVDENPYFSYGHGLAHPDPIKENRWRTTMAYNNACADAGEYVCREIPYFTNPNVTYNGFVIGTEEKNNNARVINETAFEVANYRTLPLLRTLTDFSAIGEEIYSAIDELTVDGVGHLYSGSLTTFEAKTVRLRGDYHVEKGATLHLHSGY